MAKGLLTVLTTAVLVAGRCAAQALPGDLDEVLAASDRAVSEPAPAGPSQAGNALAGLELQLWLQHYTAPDGGPSSSVTRGVLAYTHAWDLEHGWRAGFSDRVDVTRQRGAPMVGDSGDVINSLREAWLSRRYDMTDGMLYLDGGRINLRSGVASGYNPTDFFKRNAVRVATSLDPGALRSNRLGVVMLRAQRIGESGALAVALAPRLGSGDGSMPDTRGVALALERTNDAAQALVKWAPRLSQSASLDVLAYAREGDKPQAGLGFSAVLADAWVLNAEWAGGRRPMLPQLGAVGAVGAANAAEPRTHWRNRAALNVVWTMPFGLDLTLERQYVGDAMDAATWRRWRAASGLAEQRALGVLAVRRAQEQEALVRNAWFARADWRDAFGVRGLNVSGFTQRNAYDSSALSQLAASLPLRQAWSVQGQWVRYSGARDSEFGSTGVRNYVAIHLDYRF
jgi:hypothetical protein